MLHRKPSLDQQLYPPSSHLLLCSLHYWERQHRGALVSVVPAFNLNGKSPVPIINIFSMNSRIKFSSSAVFFSLNFHQLKHPVTSLASFVYLHELEYTQKVLSYLQFVSVLKFNSGSLQPCLIDIHVRVGFTNTLHVASRASYDIISLHESGNIPKIQSIIDL